MSGRLRRLILCAIAGGLLAAGTPALAGQATNTLPVDLTVAPGCSLQTNPLMFVATNALINFNIDAAATLVVKCTPNTAYAVDIDDGLHARGNNRRRMFSASSNRYIDYNVFMDARRASIWGKGSTKNLTGNSGSGAPVSIPVYGRVPAAFLIAAGDYKDTLLVTLNF